jgi:hypothetical protein
MKLKQRSILWSEISDLKSSCSGSAASKVSFDNLSTETWAANEEGSSCHQSLMAVRVEISTIYLRPQASQNSKSGSQIDRCWQQSSEIIHTYG